MYKSKTIFFFEWPKVDFTKVIFLDGGITFFLIYLGREDNLFHFHRNFSFESVISFFWRHIWAGTFVPGLIFWLFCFHRFFFNITFFVAKKVWEFVELISKLVHQCYIIWANRFTCILIVKVVRQRERTVNWYFSNFFPKKIFKMFEFDFFLWKVNHFFQSK